MSEYIQILERELSKRQKINPRYSLRSFARFLEVDSSSLSAILKGKRGLPPAKARSFAIKLGLNNDDAHSLVESSEVAATRLLKLAVQDDSDVLNTLNLETDLDARITMEWEYFTIYAFLAIHKGRPVSIARIADRLDLDPNLVEEFLADLVLKGVVAKNEDGRYSKVGGYLTANTDSKVRVDGEGKRTFSPALVASHRNTLNILQDRLDTLSPDSTVLRFACFSFDPDKFSQVQKLMEDFQKRLSSFMREQECDRVYHLSMYLVPMSKGDGEGEDI